MATREPNLAANSPNLRAVTVANVHGIPAWLPNALTLMRIALVPAWVALAISERGHALNGQPVHRFAVFLLILIIGSTDAVDGFLARRYHLESNLGAMLDAVADKLAGFAAVTFLAFFAEPAFTPLPVWLWAALIGRDVLLGIGWLVVYREHHGVQVDHQWHGRLATLLLFGVVLAACLGAPALAVDIGGIVVLALVVPGTVVYLREGWRQLKAKPRRAPPLRFESSARITLR